ncbi:MAG: Extensin-like protein [Sphingomonas bacterium]|uniref:extensin-like domain-containing protein n=1 Tax=Sphingomonas bacterium TaxID=1895847 RepID=UPI0026058306|nr:extensin family protein [Sphingomonas bacterium]MDB5703677.1 Extensin-like protein [Sphingomonas bacterium]
MRTLRRLIGSATIAAILLAGALLLFAMLRGRPRDLPWTPLDLSEPIGAFTGRKLAGLTRDFPKCRALLDRAGVHYIVLPPVHAGVCGYADGVRFAPGGSRRIPYSPADLGTSCPVAAGLSVWEWNVVQPAARRLLGSPVVAIDHYGSYNCRPIAGSSIWSEHATADAIDIAGFRLADGKRITVAADWKGNGPEATFLHQVRNGACKLFATTLSPDYNAAHRDHLHLDQAARGEFGWRACR